MAICGVRRRLVAARDSLSAAKRRRACRTPVANRAGQDAPPDVFSFETGLVGAALCHRAWRIQILPERKGSRRSGAVAGMDGFPRACCLSGVDITPLVKSGRNGIGALLAPGWYTTPLAWYGQGYNYGDTPPALLAELRIEHA